MYAGKCNPLVEIVEIHLTFVVVGDALNGRKHISVPHNLNFLVQ